MYQLPQRAEGSCNPAVSIFPSGSNSYRRTVLHNFPGNTQGIIIRDQGAASFSSSALVPTSPVSAASSLLPVPELDDES